MNFDLDSTTIIAGVLGFFFLVVAMYKTFSRRNGNQLYVPGSQKTRKEDEEVKLSDPFQSTQSPAPVNGTVGPVKSHSRENVSDRSAFKQFAPDASVIATAKIRDDSDYQWE